MALLIEEAVEHGPAALATFVHEVAGEQLLGRQLLVLSSLLLQSLLSNLNKAHSVAAATVHLVADRKCHILAIDVAQIVYRW